MINCPLCETWSNVLETRHNKKKNTTRRRYECANEHRFSTVETIDVRATSVARLCVGHTAVHAYCAKPVDH